MKIENQIKILAEMDGFERCPDASCAFRKVNHWHKGATVYFHDNISVHMLPKYLASYDAILPLIRKVCGQTDTAFNSVAVRIRYMFRIQGTITPKVIFEMTPEQLCEVLLRATEKWSDE